MLSPSLVGNTLSHADARAAVLEMVSEIRLLAVANGDLYHPGIVPDQARHFLTQVLALNLNRFLTSLDRLTSELLERQTRLLDRALRAGWELSSPRLALAYEFQVVDALPHESHDERVDWIATENGLVGEEPNRYQKLMQQYSNKPLQSEGP